MRAALSLKMKPVLWLAVALALASVTHADPLRVMSAPNLLRVGTAENVFVECQDCGGQNPLDVRISVWNYPTKSSELVHTPVTLNGANKYQALGELVIPPDTFDKNPTVKQYVYLRAEFPGYTLEKVVMVSFQLGYMFIQTDKTLYTPDSIVNFRIFAVTPGMKPLERDEATGRAVVIKVEMVTPEGIVIPLDLASRKSGIYSGSYRLSDVISIGHWKLVSRFKSNPQQTYSAEFEVKKYVLPSYEVKLTSEHPFYYFNSPSFSVTVKATYLFGKEVSGMAYVVFGFMRGKVRTVFPASLQRVPIAGGNGVATLQNAHISQTYPNINELVGGFLFVTATVYTESGSEMVEGELRNIQIVKSPYSINFDKTPKYFKAGMPFDVTVTVMNPDGTPAERVPIVVEPGDDLRDLTGTNGRATVTINPRASDLTAGTLTITARTNDDRFPAERQTSETMVAKPHQSQNFIHISMSTTNIKIDTLLKVHLVLSSKSSNFEITYLILSRGQLVDFGRQHLEGATVVLSILVTKKMLPSFRLVVYYHPSPNQVVSDSVWVDVDDSCMGTLTLKPKRPVPSYEPKTSLELEITGDPGANVGLVAVDKGVYVLNKKHLLTQKKVWEEVEKADTGCTPGGGINSMGVFFDAGLTFHTDTAGGTSYREELTCPAAAARTRRVATLAEVRSTLTGTYTAPLERECCLDGMRSTQLSYTCAQRKLYITDGKACEDAFLHCCEELAKQRRELQHSSLILARSEEDHSYLDSNDIPSRTQFPESWQWTITTIPACVGNPNCKLSTRPLNVPLKDSITTWVFTGISLSQNNGVCVGKPLDVIVYQPFFIDLKLPYSAVVGEQIEIRAVLHNYVGQAITVRVELKENPDVCSSAWKRGSYRREIRMEDSTTQAVPFVIIPMNDDKAQVNIEVVANIKNLYKGDRVIKPLRIVPYGVLTKVRKVITLDPRENQVLTVNNPIPRTSMVPNTKASTKVFITGREQVSPLVENVIGTSSMGKMIYLPTGCGEQNMYHMTHTVIATVYLDKTNQWKTVGLEKREEALTNIKAGVQNERTYLKPDGSFAVFTKEAGSTWLTAYVVKVFSMASSLTEVDNSLICNAVDYLIRNAQQQDGMFRDMGRIVHREYTGDVLGGESHASLTAFCVIALQESRVCRQLVATLPGAIDLSVKYLERHLPTLRNPYAVAITAYALANANKLNKQNKQILYGFVSPERDHWVSPRGHVFSLEATAYALLALVKANYLEDARPVVRWFTRQQKVGGGYGSTQATIMVYQAVSEYWAAAKEPNYKLNVALTVPGRNEPDTFQFTQDNHYTTRTSEKFKQFDGDVKVTLNGTGEATLTLITEYYAVPKETVSDCTKFNLSVGLTLEKVEREGDIYKLRVKFSFLKTEPASMSILDISLPTGFEVMHEDLNELSSGRAAVVSHWEFNKNLTKKGSIIFYLRQVAFDRDEELAFRMREKLPVGVLQPASVSIYEYYDETKCVKYYHPQRKDGRIMRRCRGDECLCAEENCSMQQKEHIDERKRFEKLCESKETSRIDYAYQVILEEANFDASFDIYAVRVDEVIKEGTYDKNVLGQRRKLLSFPHCRESLNLQPGTKYLIMGTADDTLESEGQTYEYLLGERTWIEHSPNEEECNTNKYRQICLGIETLIFRFGAGGCDAK